MIVSLNYLLEHFHLSVFGQQTGHCNFYTNLWKKASKASYNNNELTKKNSKDEQKMSVTMSLM